MNSGAMPGNIPVHLPDLGEQTKLIELPTTSDSVVNVSFDGSEFDGSIYDGDNDGEHNIDEYCAGTLD